MQSRFEIGIFTSSAHEYANDIIDKCLNCINFDFRLYRQHVTSNSTYDPITKNVSSVKVKDLRKLGRDLKNLILIDNFIPNFALQPENSLYIKTWENDINDIQLTGLGNMLELIDSIGFEDIREVIKILKSDYVDYKLIDNNPNPYSKITKEDLIQIKNKLSNN